MPMDFESFRLLDGKPRRAGNVSIARHVEVQVDAHPAVPVPHGTTVTLPEGRAIQVRIGSAT